jgi:tetratricopeptide (TPR) repeat protein
MAKRINKSLVGGLAVAVFALMTAGGVLFVNSLQSTDPTQFIEMGKQAASEGNFKSARGFYQHAYSQTDDPTYLIDVGSMFLAEGKQREAMQSWQSALVQKPTLSEARIKIIDLLIEVCLAVDKPSDWRDLIRAGEELLRHEPENAKAAHAIGLGKSRVAATRAEVLEAQQYIEKAVKYDASNVNYAVDLAEYYAGQGQWERAQTTYENLMATKQSPGADAVEARIAYANALQRADKIEESQQYLHQAISLVGNDPESLAKAHCAIGQFWVNRWASDRADLLKWEDRTYYDKARQAFEQAIAAQPEGFEAYKRLAELYMSVEEYQKIIDLCQKRFDLPRESEGLEGWLQSNDIYRLECWSAMASLGAATEFPSGSEEQNRLLNQAEKFALTAISRAPMAEFAHITAAQIKAERGNVPAAIADLEEASKVVEGLSWQGLKNLAIFYKSEMQFGKALELIEKAADDSKADLVTHRVYLEMLLSNNRVNDMIEHAQLMLSKYPRHKPFLEQLMEGYRITGQNDRLEAVRKQLEALGEDYSLPEARVLAGRGLFNEAIKKAERILEDNPSDLQTLSFVGRLLVEQNQRERAIELLNKGLEANPDSLDIKQMLITAEAGDSEEQLFENLLALRKEGIKDPFARAGEIGGLCLQFGKTEEAREQYAEALRIFDAKESPTAQNLSFQGVRGLVETNFRLALDAKDWDVAEDMLSRAIKLDLDGCGGLLFQGQMHNAKGEYERAQDTLVRTLARQPGNSAAMTGLGDAYWGMNQTDSAEDAYARAIEVNPYDGTAHKGLARIAEQRNDVALFMKHLKPAARYLPRDPWVMAQRTMIEEKADPNAAIARRERIRKSEPSNLENLWQLVQLYAATNQRPKADEIVREYAGTAGPSDESVPFRVATYFCSTNRRDRGMAVLQQAVSRASDDSAKVRMLLMQSTLQQSLKMMNEAEKSILEAAAVELSASVAAAAGQFYLKRGDLDEALAWVKKDIAAVKDDQVNKQNLSRLQLEILLKMGRSDEMLALAEEHQQLYGNDGVATLLKSQALVESGKLEEALTLLGTHIQEHPNDARALYDLASLQATMSQWATVVDSLENLRNINPAALNYLPRVLLIEAYVRSEQRDKVALEIDAILNETSDLSPIVKQLVPMLQNYELYPQCMKVLSMVINRDPKNPLYLGWRGDTALKMEVPGRAYVDYNTAYVASDRNPYYAIKLLEYFGVSNERSAGRAFFEELPDQLKKEPRVRYRLAPLLAEHDDIAPALHEYQSILTEVGSEHPDICFETLDSAVKSFSAQKLIQASDASAAGDAIKLAALIGASAFADASAIWIQAAERHAGHALMPILATYGAKALSNTKQTSEAVSAYEQAIEGSKNNARALKELGALLLANARSSSDAKKYLERGVAVDPNDAEALALLAGAYFATNDAAKGCSLAHRALSIDSDCVPAMLELGNYFLSLEFHKEESRGLLLDAYRLTTSGRYPEWRTRVVAAFSSLDQSNR